MTAATSRPDITVQVVAGICVLAFNGALFCACAVRSNGGISVQEALQREIEPLPVHDALSDDGAVVIQVESSGPPRISRNDSNEVTSYVINVPIAPARSIECALWPNLLHATNLWHALHREMTNATLQNAQLADTDAGVMLDRPFLYLEVAGTQLEDGEPRVQTVKNLIVGSSGGTLVCVHAAVGFRASFKRIVSGMVASLRLREAEEGLRLTYQEIHVVKVQGRALGFVDTRYFDLGADGRLASKRMGMIVPRTPTDWMAMDALRLDRSDTQGVISRAEATTVSGAELTHKLVLQRSGSGYHVEGTLHGKAVSADLPTVGAATDDIRLARTLERVAKSNGPWPVRSPQWLPDANPLEIIDVEVGCQGGSCQYKIGATTAQMGIDEKGMATSATFTLPGGGTMTTERLFARGKL